MGHASPGAGTPIDPGRCPDRAPLGCDGHSDADVLAHAITDAMLGAAALGDIGMHFPDTDPRWKNADSLQFLRARTRSAPETGLSKSSNVDSTVILERPKLKDYRFDIRQKLAATLDLPVEQVSVKFKTAERLGPVGEGKSAEAQAVVTIRKMEKDTESGHKYRV